MKSEQLLSLTKESDEGGGKEIEIISEEDETKKILRSSTAVIENENGQTVGMVSVLSDITKQKKLDELKLRDNTLIEAITTRGGRKCTSPEYRMRRGSMLKSR